MVFFSLGSPMPSSLSSPSVTEHSHSQPPSPNLHDNQSSVLSNATTQAAQDSDSEEYTAALYRPVTQPALSHSCNGKVTLSLSLSLSSLSLSLLSLPLLLSSPLALSLSLPLSSHSFSRLSLFSLSSLSLSLSLSLSSLSLSLSLSLCPASLWSKKAWRLCVPSKNHWSKLYAGFVRLY